MTTDQIQLTTELLNKVTQAMRNARERIELEQNAPINLDQACVFHSLCEGLNIDPMAVLDQETLMIIDPGEPAPPLIEILTEDLELLKELKAVALL